MEHMQRSDPIGLERKRAVEDKLKLFAVTVEENTLAGNLGNI